MTLNRWNDRLVIAAFVHRIKEDEHLGIPKLFLAKYFPTQNKLRSKPRLVFTGKKKEKPRISSRNLCFL
ncbi:hypothetical protein L1887_22050 [Cichorium endivia]|nr:hypothetical protein L1887_22050 [Cichorium endivia]